MLGGLAPILIFNFPLNVAAKLPTANALSGIPLLADTVIDAALSIGVPIPLYLDERLTGVYVESENKAMDIDEIVQPRYDGLKPIVDQRAVNSLVTINMLANRNSVVLSVLLALNDMIFTRLISREYHVSYLNGPTAVFAGLLHGFSTQAGADDDLVRITMQLSKGNQAGLPANVASVLPKITGATPVPL